MDSNKRREVQIAYFNSLNVAVNFIPENKKGTDEGYELLEKYHRQLYGKFTNWYEKLNGDKSKTADDI